MSGITCNFCRHAASCSSSKSCDAGLVSDELAQNLLYFQLASWASVGTPQEGMYDQPEKERKADSEVEEFLEKGGERYVRAFNAKTGYSWKRISFKNSGSSHVHEAASSKGEPLPCEL